MLFNNLTLLCFLVFFFSFLLRQFDVCEIHEVFIKPTIQSITGMYFSSLFLCFFPAMVDKYISHASIREFKLPFNILNTLLFARCDQAQKYMLYYFFGSFKYTTIKLIGFLYNFFKQNEIYFFKLDLFMLFPFSFLFLDLYFEYYHLILIYVKYASYYVLVCNIN